MLELHLIVDLWNECTQIPAAMSTYASPDEQFVQTAQFVVPVNGEEIMLRIHRALHDGSTALSAETSRGRELEIQVAEDASRSDTQQNATKTGQENLG